MSSTWGPEGLRCVDCGARNLEIKPDALECGNCGRVYAIVDGIYCMLPRELDAALAEIRTLSKAKLGDGKHSVYLDEDKARFVALAAGRLNAGAIFVLLDGKPAAYRLNFEFSRARFCLDASYDRSYPKFELGAFSVEASIRDSFRQGLLLHCEGTGVEFYKTKFTKEFIGIHRVLIPGNTAKSPIYVRWTGALLRTRWSGVCR